MFPFLVDPAAAKTVANMRLNDDARARGWTRRRRRQGSTRSGVSR